MLIRHGLSDAADPREALVALDEVGRIVSSSEGFAFLVRAPSPGRPFIPFPSFLPFKQ